MKISSSKIVQLYIFLLSACLVLGCAISAILWFFDLRWTLQLGFIVAMLSIILILLQKCSVVDYDSTGEVLSVKKYFVLFPKQMELFEIPKIYVTKWKIEKKIWKSYLILYFENSQGKKLIRYIDISTYTQQQILKIQSDLNQYEQR